MSPSKAQLSGFVAQYLVLTKSRRRIFQYLRWYQSRFKETYPTMARIAKSAGISERAVQKFFEELRDNNTIQNYLLIKKRTNKWGGDSSNLFILNTDFRLAMDWLSIHSYLNAPRHKTNKIISSIEKQEKVHPLPPQKFTPLSITPFNINPHTFRPNVWINPALKDLRGLDDWAKQYASRYASDHEIQDTLEACRYHEKRIKIANPSKYFMGTLKNKIRKRIGK
jgi:hypothetical protein